jgi:predicted nucleic acid-binding protein
VGGLHRCLPADDLVFGDNDLLALKEHGGIRIISPHEFEWLFR